MSVALHRQLASHDRHRAPLISHIVDDKPRRLFETGKRRPHDARADLPAIAAGDADIEDRQHLAFDDLEDVDAGGRAAKAERRNADSPDFRRR